MRPPHEAEARGVCGGETIADSAPLDFRFIIDATHRSFRIARLHLPARHRDALIRSGIETLNELHGLTARQIAAIERMDGRAAFELVGHVRWRCVESLPSWPLLRQSPVMELWWPVVSRVMLIRRGVTDIAGAFALGDEGLAAACGAGPAWARNVLDVLARVAELPPDRLRVMSKRTEPWELPKIDPVILLALAKAERLDEQVVALSLGGPTRDSLLLLARWMHSRPAPPSFDELGQQFGVSGKRARQIVTIREDLLRKSGLRIPMCGESLRSLMHDPGLVEHDPGRAAGEWFHTSPR